MKLPNSSSWHGSIKLVYQYRQRQTLMASAHARAPFKIQSPFYPEGKSKCHSLILHTAGGIVGGDSLEQDIRLQPRARVVISNPAATKIYGSNGKTARQQVKITLERDSHLQYLPQETIVFNGANFRQKIQIELGLQSTWLGWDIIRFGRSARGEIFNRGEWIATTEVWQDGFPLWIDRQWLPGNEQLFYSQNGLAGKPVVATLSWLGQNVTDALVRQIRDLGRESLDALDFGVTQLVRGLLCRYRGNSVSEVKNWFVDIAQLLHSIPK